MKKPQTEQNINWLDIPLGVWHLDGRWEHNPNMKMTREEQYKHNLEGGHFKEALEINDTGC